MPQNYCPIGCHPRERSSINEYALLNVGRHKRIHAVRDVAPQAKGLQPKWLCTEITRGGTAGSGNSANKACLCSNSAHPHVQNHVFLHMQSRRLPNISTSRSPMYCTFVVLENLKS
eukprot:2055155-Pyramimonas_sp.AAC.1